LSEFPEPLSGFAIEQRKERDFNGLDTPTDPSLFSLLALCISIRFMLRIHRV
jgi:hypothetical protein